MHILVGIVLAVVLTGGKLLERRYIEHEMYRTGWLGKNRKKAIELPTGTSGKEIEQYIRKGYDITIVPEGGLESVWGDHLFLI